MQRMAISFMFVFLIIISAISMSVSASHEIANVNDFYTNTGIHHDTEISAGTLHLRPLAHFYVESTTDKDIVAVSYDYVTMKGYFLTDEGNLYVVNQDHTVELVKAFPPEALALDAFNSMIAVAAAGGSPEKNPYSCTLYIYYNGKWISNDYEDLRIQKVKITDKYVVAGGLSKSNSQFIVYDLSSGEFHRFGIYFDKSQYQYYKGVDTNVAYATIASTTVAGAAVGNWIGAIAGGVYGIASVYALTTTPAANPTVIDKDYCQNYFSIEYFPDAFLITDGYRILVFSQETLDNAIKNNEKDFQANIYYSMPEYQEWGMVGLKYFPLDGTLIGYGKGITLKFNMVNGGHIEVFNHYSDPDDPESIIAVGSPVRGEYLYFEHNNASYYVENVTMNHRAIETTDGKHPVIYFVDNEFTVANIWAGKEGNRWYVGYYDIRNYAPYGYWVSDPVDCRLPEQDKIKIAAVNMSWNAETPNGTNYAIFVSNDNGATWYNITDYNGKEFSNWTTDYHHSIFRYKVIMSSPQQILTPFIRSIKYNLVTYAPAAVEIDPVAPHYTLVPVNFTAHATGDVDGHLKWANWTFGEPPSQMVPGEQAYINLTPGTWADFNDDLAVSHVYARPGNYRVTLTVCDDDNQITTAVQEITILNRIPIVNISYSVVSGTGHAGGDSVSVLCGSQIFFDASDSYDLDGDISKVEWHIGDNIYTGMNTTYTAPTVVGHPIKITAFARVYDTDGGSNDSISVTIYVSPDDLFPIADFSAPSVVQVGDTIVLDASPSWDDNGIVNYTWDINGQKYYSKIITYVPSDCGILHVSLKVTDAKNQSDYYNRTIRVQYWPAYGDWIITTHIVVRNASSPAFHGNIIIKSGGWLEAYNLKIVFGCKYDGQYKLEVEEGGKITTENSEFDSVYFYDPNLEMQHWQRFHWNFIVDGEAHLNRTKIYALNGDKSSYVMGITVSGSLYMHQSEIDRSKGSISTMSVSLTTPYIELRDGAIYQSPGIQSLNSKAFLYASGLTMKSTLGYINNQGMAKITDSTFTFCRDGSGIENYGTMILLNSTVKYADQVIDIYSTNTVLDSNIIYGKGNRSKGYHAAVQTTIKNSTVSWCWVGVYAEADTTIINTQGTLNTQLLGAQGCTIFVKNFLTVKITYLGNPVVGANVLVWADGTEIYDGKTDSTGMIHNIIVPYGYTRQTEYEMIYYTTTASVFNTDPEILDINRTINMSTSHTEYWTYGSPEQSQGATSFTTSFSDIWGWVAILLTWVGLFVLWLKRILRLPLIGVILTALIATAAIAWFMLQSIFIFIIIGTLWFAYALLWLYHVFGLKIKAILGVGLGVFTAWHWWQNNGTVNAFDIGSILDISLLIPVAIVGVSVALYMLRDFGRGKEAYYFGGTMFIALLAYLWLTNPWLVWVIAILGMIAAVVYYLITTDAQLSFGTAALIIALLGIASIAIAYFFGLWHPGMYAEIMASEIARSMNPLRWLGLSFQGVIP